MVGVARVPLHIDRKNLVSPRRFVLALVAIPLLTAACGHQAITSAGSTTTSAPTTTTTRYVSASPTNTTRHVTPTTRARDTSGGVTATGWDVSTATSYERYLGLAFGITERTQWKLCAMTLALDNFTPTQALSGDYTDTIVTATMRRCGEPS